MAQTDWTLAQLNPDQEQLLRKDESTLGNSVLLAFSPGGGGPGAERYRQLTPSQLTPGELECVQGLEQKMGVTLVAVQK